ncbi:MAG: ATP synthase subunit I [Desulfobacterales bacterium]|nr:ATP synthase subunit I [Desulfobacterales bacterium]
MESIRQIQKKYCSRAIILAIVLGLGFILAGYKPIGKGLILGTLFGILNFILMGETLPWRVGQSKNKATAISAVSILFRYALLAIPIFIGVRFPEFNVAAAIIGIFMVQFVLLGEQILRLITPLTKK